MSTVQEFKCIFCKEQFDDKETLQTHFRKHGDPQFNQSKTKTRPQWHKPEPQISGEQSKDGTEMVGCDVCPEVFPTISKAITHKHKVHPDHDAKYFCPWCGKLFTMKHLYNKHLQANHENKEVTDEMPYHCDSCEVDFYVPTAMLYHNKFFHRQDTDIPPFGNSKKLKMHNQEVLQVYYCSFCGEEYVNKVNLHKHTHDDHSDENQSPDEVLRCPLCDAIFYHLDAYEVHLTFHSVEDLYSEKNELMNDISEFSLEAVPPSTEKVENCEPQQDAETTMAEMSFEDVLQLAAENSSEKLLKKSKKHKKHKKSKKSAITLDEFLNMNKDVFGEGLDFQGVEEVPTRAITKRLKVSKKGQIPCSKSSPELDKLRRQGIIIKKKSGGQIITKPLKISQNALTNKSKCNTKEGTKLSSSNEVLSKLLNQSNNEIQIVKKSSQEDNNINLCEVIFKEESGELPAAFFEDDNMECDSTKKELGETAADSKQVKESEQNLHKSYNTSYNNSDISEKNTSQDSQETSTCKSDCQSPSTNSTKDTKLNDVINENNFSTHKNIATVQKSEKSSDFKNGLGKIRQNAVNMNTSDMEANSNIHDENSSEINTNVELNDETELPTKLEKDTTHSTNESLSALKHLSHFITVKPVSQTKNAIADNTVGDTKNIYKKKFDAVGNSSMETSVTSTNSCKDVNDVSPMTEAPLGTLKKTRKNITFKCLPRKINDGEMKSADFNDSYAEDDEFVNPLQNTNNNQDSNKELCGSTTQSISVDTNTDTLRSSPTTDTNYTDDLPFQKDIVNNDHDLNNTSSHLLKHLTSITAKPLNITRSVNKVTPIYSSSHSRSIVNKNITRTIQSMETNQDDIEILHIDDSDSDDVDNINQKTLAKPKNPQMLESCKSVTVKNVGKEITQSQTQITEPNNYTNQNKSVPGSPHTRVVSQKIPNEKNVAIKNVLKALGKNITVKSKNSSPIHIVKQQEQHSENNDITENDFDTDTDSCSGRVKITEICEDHASDEEIKQNQSNQNAIIQMPEDSCSENEAETHVNEDTDGHESDFESNIKINTLQKPDPSIQQLNHSTFDSFKNISKDITIKSLSDNNNREQISKSVPVTGNSQNNSHTSLKQVRNQQENNNNSGVVVGQRLSTSSNNQKMASSSNQVNKEVTVKTFQTQTKTVIQEITTTVTKTIKTVNQTVKEESSNSSQSIPSQVVTQKIQGVRANQKPTMYQGITVRHATSPGMRPQIRNPTPVRPGGSNIIRAPNKLTPVSGPRVTHQILRPGTNVTRLNTPRPSGQQKIRPTMGNTQGLNMGKPLKISPNAVVSSSANKRPNPEEAAGPFSCFKKTKESLIPGSEIPTFSKSDDTKMEYSSTVQMSKSNFMSTVKTVKGNSVVTSTQMKSEMSASSQQLSKLTNMSGLRVVKTSQNNKVQETSTNSGMKQTTLEAIEKLQKQGLLIKKPRLDHSEDSVHSDADGDDNIDYSSIDENND